MKFWLLLLAYAISDVVATISSARWLKDNNPAYLVISFIAYTACTISWLISIRSSDAPNFTRAMVIYPIWALLVGLLTGLLVMRDHINIQTWLGIVLGLIALLLVASD